MRLSPFACGLVLSCGFFLSYDRKLSCACTASAFKPNWLLSLLRRFFNPDKSLSDRGELSKWSLGSR